MVMSEGTSALGPALEGASPGAGSWAAVLLVSLSTLAGAWLARRNSAKVTVWLAIASAMMLITALVDLLPDAWRDAGETGVPLWAVGLAIVSGFLVITYFTRKGCGHGHGHGGSRTPLTHAQLREAVSTGRMSLSEVLARTDDVVKNAWVGWLLSLLPGHNPAEITNVLTAGGIDASRHIGDLTDRQRRYLLTTITK